MPQPFRERDNPRTGVLSGPDILLQRPELAAHIGNVCANWNVFEGAVIMLFGLIVGDYGPRSERRPPSFHPLSLHVMDAMNAFGPKMDLVTKLGRHTLTPEQFEKWSDIRDRGRRLFATRSQIVHGKWGVHAGEPDALILCPSFGSMMLYKRQDFEDVSARIKAALLDLNLLVHELYQ